MSISVTSAGGMRAVSGTCVTPISRASAAKLPPALLEALRDVRNAQAHNEVPVREVYAFAYHNLFTADPVVREREQAAIRKALAAAGHDVERLLAPASVRRYEQAVSRAAPRAATKDLPGMQLARTGEQAFAERTFLNCLDYAKATAHRAWLRDPSLELRFFVVMDVAGYQTMCPRGPSAEPAGPQRPIVHTMVAYPKDGRWWVVSPEMDLAKGDLEIFDLGRGLPARLGSRYRLEDAPFVRGKDLVYAGSYDFKSPFIGGAVHPQTLKNIAASGIASTMPADYVCR
ncbi:MAG: hypothetical protein ACAI38_23795 [Myxococcota bacterium]